MEKMPKMLYGTAWKKSETSRLVTLALNMGFKGIDTACQPKHYHEPGVGEAVANFNRDEIFIQTKFTSFNGQDPTTCPYDKNLPLEEQVAVSLKTSLTNLRTSYIDSLVLHGPMRTHQENLQIWKTFESFVHSKEVRMLGISNFYKLSDIVKLYNDAEIKPQVIQNRFYEDTNFDREIRYFCKEKGIIYQSFWTLTANPQVLANSDVIRIATEKKVTPEALFFGYLIQTGVVPLTGTKSATHMKDDLQAVNISLTETEKKIFEKLVG